MRDARKMRLLMILTLVVCLFAVGCANPAPRAERFVSEESFTVRFYVFNGSSYGLGVDDEHNKYVVSGIVKNGTVALPALDGVKGWAVFSVVPRGIIRENDSGITVFDSNSHIIGDTDVYAVYAAPQAVEPEPELEPEPESEPEVETYVVRFSCLMATLANIGSERDRNMSSKALAKVRWWRFRIILRLAIGRFWRIVRLAGYMRIPIGLFVLIRLRLSMAIVMRMRYILWTFRRKEF